MADTVLHHRPGAKEPEAAPRPNGVSGPEAEPQQRASEQQRGRGRDGPQGASHQQNRSKSYGPATSRKRGGYQPPDQRGGYQPRDRSCWAERERVGGCTRLNCRWEHKGTPAERTAFDEWRAAQSGTKGAGDPNWR